MKLRISLTLLSIALVASGGFVLYRTYPLYAWAQPVPTVISPARSQLASDSNSVDGGSPEKSIQRITDGTPQHISVPDLSIDVNLSPGNYDPVTSQWGISDSSAFFASVTDYANLEIGNNLFIYGHNSRRIFGNLLYIRPDTKVFVTTEEGETIEFSFLESMVVDPTESNIFDYNGNPRLIIQTCTGAFNQQRQIIYLERVS